MHVFAREFAFDSSRCFIVTGLSDFYIKSMHMRDEHRTFYEIIRTNNPFRLYLDLECDLSINGDFD